MAQDNLLPSLPGIDPAMLGSAVNAGKKELANQFLEYAGLTNKASKLANERRDIERAAAEAAAKERAAADQARSDAAEAATLKSKVPFDVNANAATQGTQMGSPSDLSQTIFDLMNGGGGIQGAGRGTTTELRGLRPEEIPPGMDPAQAAQSQAQVTTRQVPRTGFPQADQILNLIGVVTKNPNLGTRAVQDIVIQTPSPYEAALATQQATNARLEGERFNQQLRTQDLETAKGFFDVLDPAMGAARGPLSMELLKAHKSNNDLAVLDLLSTRGKLKADQIFDLQTRNAQASLDLQHAQIRGEDLANRITNQQLDQRTGLLIMGINPDGLLKPAELGTAMRELTTGQKGGTWDPAARAQANMITRAHYAHSQTRGVDGQVVIFNPPPRSVLPEWVASNYGDSYSVSVERGVEMYKEARYLDAIVAGHIKDDQMPAEQARKRLGEIQTNLYDLYGGFQLGRDVSQNSILVPNLRTVEPRNAHNSESHRLLSAAIQTTLKIESEAGYELPNIGQKLAVTPIAPPEKEPVPKAPLAPIEPLHKRLGRAASRAGVGPSAVARERLRRQPTIPPLIPSLSPTLGSE